MGWMLARCELIHRVPRRADDMPRAGSPGKNRREHYRIVYPIRARPRLRVGKAVFPVLDLCERGLRFLHPDPDSLQLGQTIRGRVSFGDGTSMVVEGEVMRTGRSEAVLHLAIRIPPARILQEQRHLIGRFPGYS